MKNIPVHSTKDFAWDAACGFFIAEDSDFKHKTLHSRVYDDAADIGFYLKSHATGKKCLMLLHETCAKEDYITAWRYQGNIDGQVIVIYIYND
jgi:hypothetical protein